MHVIEFNLIGYKNAEGKIGADKNFKLKSWKFEQNSVLWNILFRGVRDTWCMYKILIGKRKGMERHTWNQRCV